MSVFSPYHIVTEFRFDIAHAVADSRALQGAVGAISTAADEALINIKRASAGLVAQMGIVSGGVLGFLYNAIMASEKFDQSQRNLANILYTNRATLKTGYMSFNDTLEHTEHMMQKIREKAFGFALDPTQLLNQTKTIAPVLLSHGLDNKNLDKSIDISRGMLKSAPTLGVDPQLVQNQLTNMLLGHAGMNDTLFQRLVSETAPFREGGIKKSQDFNRLDAHKRVEMVRKALLQFGSTAQVIEGNINSLSGNMTKFTSLIKGEFSILRPLGQALLVPIKQAFNFVNTWLDTQGRVVIEKLSSVLGNFIENPLDAYVNLKQLARLQKDVSNSSQIAKIVGLWTGLRFVLGYFGLQLGGVGAMLMRASRYLWIFLSTLVTSTFFVKLISYTFTFLRLAAIEFMAIMAPLIFLFQILSATVAKLQIIWANWMAKNAGRMASALQVLSDAFGRIMLPITMAIDGMSDVLSSIFGWFITKEILLSILEGIGSAMESVALVIVMALSTINGAVGALFSMIFDLINGNFKGIFDRAGQEYEDSWQEFFKKAYRIKDKPTDEAGSVANSVTNINNLNVNQHIKEQVEPDRIAFSAVEAFKKVAQNPTRAYNSRMSAGMVSR